MTLGLGPQEWQAVWLSLKVAFVATLFALPFAVLAAHTLARRSFPGKHLLNVLVHLPLVMPPVVTGYLLLVVFGQSSGIGWLLDQAFGITLAFQWTGAALAAGIMAFPLMVRAIRLGFEAVDPGLEQAAATLGSSRARVFIRVVMPLIVPSVLAGTILGFAKALGEFGATITFVAAIPGETLTIPSAIYGLLQVPGQTGPILSLIALSIAFATGALIMSEWLATRMAKRFKS